MHRLVRMLLGVLLQLATLRPEFWVSGWTDAAISDVSASGLLGSASALTTAATIASSPKLVVGVPSI